MTEFNNLVAQFSYHIACRDINSQNFDALMGQIKAYAINMGWTSQEAAEAFNRAQAQWLYR